MTKHAVVFIPGDGIGPEVSLAAKRCLEATGVSFEWIEAIAGESAIANGSRPSRRDAAMRRRARSMVTSRKLA